MREKEFVSDRAGDLSKPFNEGPEKCVKMKIKINIM